MMKDHRMTTCLCPACGYTLEAASGIAHNKRPLGGGLHHLLEVLRGAEVQRGSHGEIPPSGRPHRDPGGVAWAGGEAQGDQRRGQGENRRENEGGSPVLTNRYLVWLHLTFFLPSIHLWGGPLRHDHGRHGWSLAGVILARMALSFTAGVFFAVGLWSWAKQGRK